ncbi:MAG: hypothetical protein AAFY74_10060 [Pseudomonadota bacterium]
MILEIPRQADLERAREIKVRRSWIIGFASGILFASVVPQLF